MIPHRVTGCLKRRRRPERDGLYRTNEGKGTFHNSPCDGYLCPLAFLSAPIFFMAAVSLSICAVRRYNFRPGHSRQAWDDLNITTTERALLQDHVSKERDVICRQ